MADSADTLAYIKFLADMYEKNKKKDVDFKQVPMSPEQKELFDYAMGRMKALPDTTKDLYPTAAWNATHGPSIDVAALKRGEVGYTAPQRMTAPDLAGVLRNDPKPDQGAADTQGAAGGASASNPFGMAPSSGAAPGSSFEPYNVPPSFAGTGNKAPGPTGEPGIGSGLNIDLNWLEGILRSQGVKDAVKIGAGYLAGNLPGAIAAGIKVMIDRATGGKPPPPRQLPPGQNASGLLREAPGTKQGPNDGEFGQKGDYTSPLAPQESDLDRMARLAREASNNPYAAEHAGMNGFGNGAAEAPWSGGSGGSYWPPSRWWGDGRSRGSYDPDDVGGN